MSESAERILKVWTFDHTIKKGVVSASYQDLIIQCRQKFNIEQEKEVMFVLKDDETEIDENYFRTLKKDTVLLIRTNDEQKNAGTSTSTSTSCTTNSSKGEMIVTKTQAENGENAPGKMTNTNTQEEDANDDMIVSETPAEEGENASENKDGVERKTKLYWLDTMDDEIFLKTFASSMDKLKKNDVVRIKNISEAKDKTGKIIAICRKSSCRLENMLDFYLQKENESIFKRVLVIIVHNSSHGEPPKVSSKEKLGDLERYKMLQNVIDVCYHVPGTFDFFNRKKNPDIIFGKDDFSNFLSYGNNSSFIN